MGIKGHMENAAKRPKTEKPTLEAIKYNSGKLQLLDQKKLPFGFSYINVESVQDGWTAIREMNVRGAPLIAISAALSLCVEAYQKRADDATVDAAAAWLLQQLDFLKT